MKSSLASAPRQGLGTWNIGQGRHPAATEVVALHAGLDLGLCLIDTAEMYGEGRSERLVGQALASWMPLEPGAPRPWVVSKVLPNHASRQGVRRACEGSLRRLGLERIDLYLLHWRGTHPLDETVDAFERLRAEGRIGHWGVSNFDVADMEDLWAVPGGHHCAANQVLYNPASRGIEFDLLPWCASRGVTVMAYCPLGHGDLVGHPLLAEIGRRHGVSGTAVALAWAARSGAVIAVAESGNPQHVRDNAAALQLRLDEADLAAIDALWPPPEQKAPLDML